MKPVIDNIPNAYINESVYPELFVYDLKMEEEAIKTKVNLNMHMFSFLQKGTKQVHFAEGSFLVDNSQSILIAKGNCLWSELLDTEETYYCKLLFFSEERLKAFLKKHKDQNNVVATSSCFVIENDAYIDSYLNSLNTIKEAPKVFMENLLSVKFDELLLYLTNKYGQQFENYLYSLIEKESSSFKKVVESNVLSSLALEEIAFLCNMSLSTFKRNFIKEYQTSPGKWFRDQRLSKAKELLEDENTKPSDIYLELGYNNLSNFSAAFKKKFKVSPSEI